MTNDLHRMPCLTFHAQERAIERLGRNLTWCEWLQVVLAITDRPLTHAAIIRRGWRGEEEWAVSIDGVLINLIWDPHKACIITVYGIRADGQWSSLDRKCVE
jgi:hypothetical protein